jgi:hypothetical protein
MTYTEQSSKPVGTMDLHFEFERFRMKRIYAAATVPMIPVSGILPWADSGVLESATANRQL